MRWSMEFSQYEICYLPKFAIKGQVVANFIVKLIPNEEIKVSQDPSSTAGESPMAAHLALAQDLYVEGSLNGGGYGAGLVFISYKPKCVRIEYASQLGFKTSNNEAKYKAFLVSLRLACKVGTKHHHILIDSQLEV